MKFNPQLNQFAKTYSYLYQLGICTRTPKKLNKKDNIKDGRVFLCILASVQTSRAENLPKPKPY